MKEFRVWHKEYAKGDGRWFWIANEKEKGKVNDEDVYHYVENSVDLNKIRNGDTIMLDEEFKILEGGKPQTKKQQVFEAL